MVGDYISREVANKWICETCDDCEGTFCASCDGNPLKDIPAADVVEVRHGSWEWDRVRESYRCSACEAYNADRTAYCPNCGAKMDGGQDDV